MKTCSCLIQNKRSFSDACLIQNKRSFSDVSEEILPDGKETGFINLMISLILKLEAKHKPAIFVYE